MVRSCYLYLQDGHHTCLVRHISRCCIWRSLLFSLYITDCNYNWPIEVQTIVSYQYVNPVMCRVWDFCCFWWEYTMFWSWFDFFLFCLTRILLVFCFVFKSILLGMLKRSSANSCRWMWTPRMQSESCFCFCLIHAVSIFYTLYWNNVLCRLQLWKCV